jgi:hypothetical protein
MLASTPDGRWRFLTAAMTGKGGDKRNFITGEGSPNPLYNRLEKEL